MTTGRRRWAGAALPAGLAGLVAAVVLTAPWQAAVSGLDLPEEVALRVLAVRPNDPSFAVIDLQARTEARYRRASHGMGADAVDGAVVTPGRADTIIWSDGVARLFSGSLGRADAELRPAPLRRAAGAAPSLRVVPARDGEAVWLVQPGQAIAGESRSTFVQLVELPSRRELLATELEPGTFPVAATGSGLVLTSENLVDTGDGWVTEPGSERVRHLATDGTVDDVGRGRALAASDAEVVRLACDPPPARCALRLSAPDGSRDRSVPAPGDGHWDHAGGPLVPSDTMPLQTVSPDGSQLLVAMAHGGGAGAEASSSTLLAVDLASGDSRGIATFDAPAPAATWSRDGRWIVLFQGRDILVVGAGVPGASPRRLRDAVPADHHVFAAG